MADPGRVFQRAAAFRAELLRGERAAASEIVRAYGNAWKHIEPSIRSLAKRYYEALDAEERISPSWLFQLERLQSVQRQVESEIAGVVQNAEVRIRTEQWNAVEAARRHAEALVEPQLPDGISVSWSRLNREAVTDLVGFTSDGSPLRELLDELPGDAGHAVREALISGVTLGQSPYVIARRSRAALGGNMARALRISRTEVMRSYREATLRNYQANAGIVTGWVWHSAVDTRTCPMCFPAGVVVSGPRPEKVFSRHYTGDIVVIQTAGGEDLPVTPNHPILTSRGWVRAGAIREGDDVVRRTRPKRATPDISVDDYQMPTLIEQVAVALAMIPAEMECAAPYFHGDGVGSDVYVVWANGLLRGHSEIPGPQHRQKRGLCSGRMMDLAGFSFDLPTQGGSNAFLPGLLVRTGMILEDHCTFRQGNALAAKNVGFLHTTPGHSAKTQAGGNSASGDAIRLRQSQLELAGLVAGCDLGVRESLIGMAAPAVLATSDGIALLLVPQETALAQHGREALPTDAESGRGLLRSLAGKVSFDRVLQVAIRRFRGHVYNLQTAEGWYEANGIIAHNCWAMHGSEHGLDERLDDHVQGRCAMVPRTKSWAELGFAGVEETSPQVEPGVDVFARLDEVKQRAILGPAAHEAYRAGAVKLTDFVGRRESADWGTMRYARSLKAIVGEEEAAKWRARALGRDTEPEVKALPVHERDLDTLTETAQVEQWLHHRYPNVRFDFEGAHIETIVPTARQFDEMARLYPHVAAQLQYVGTYRGAGSPAEHFGREWAHASSDGKRIGLNPRAYRDPTAYRQQLEEAVRVRWNPAGCGSIESILTHEFGHMVLNELLASSEALVQHVAMDGRGLIHYAVEAWLDKQRPGARLSRYATVNKRERWAEAFASLYHTSPSQRVTMVKRMERLLEEVAPDRRIARGVWGQLSDLAHGSQEREEALEALKDLQRRLGL